MLLFPVVRATPPAAPIVWGIVATGQSLSVGARAGDAPYATLVAGAGSDHYMLGNLVGSGGISLTANPEASWTLQTLSEPLRGSHYATIWPSNAMNQTPHAPMASRLSSLIPGVKTAHTVVGQNGQPMSGIRKGGGVASYAGSIAEATKLRALLGALGYDYRVAAVLLTHGEQDLGSATYGTEVLQLQADYETDLKTITGQAGTIPLIATQPSAGYPQPGVGNTSNINDVLLSTYLANPSRVILAGSKIGLSYFSGDFHIDAAGSRDLGYLYADAVAPIITGGTAFAPLYPVSATRSGSVVTVTLNRSASFDTSLWGTTHASAYSGAWVNGKGFEAVDGGGAPISITSVSIVGAVVTITCASAPTTISNALYGDGTGTIRRTQVRDSSGNWLVQFSRAV
jgi:hypothetical protein